MSSHEKKRISTRKDGTVAVKKSREDSPILVESKERPSEEFIAICKQLNIDQELLNSSWRQYDTIGQQCSLEGDEMPWIACSIYLTLWQNIPFPIIQAVEPQIKLSTSKLISVCGVSVLEFFEKLSKWAEMATGLRRIQEHVNRIQGSLAVSAVVFKKILPIFRTLFAIQRDSKRKEIRRKISVNVVFEIIWMLFIVFKKNFAGVGDDLLNCFHLLLCIVDLVYADIKAGNMADLMNPEFVGIKETEEEIVMETLCRVFEGVILDAKHFRTHWWRPRLRTMVENGVFKADSDTLTGFLDNSEHNLLSLHNMYEETMLKRGEIDERIFLPKDVHSVFDRSKDASQMEQLKHSPNKPNGRPLDTELLLRMSLQACLEKLTREKSRPTPLTGKSYVISGEQFCPVSPVKAATYNANKMAQLLAYDWMGSSPELDLIMGQWRDHPREFVIDSVRLMGNRLENRVAVEKETKGMDFDSHFNELIEQRRQQIDCLFYRLLEKVLVAERERTDETHDLSSILHKDEFLSSIYACAMELILDTYGSERQFPWSLDVLHLAPVHFYKVIELVIRAESEMSREMVKHMNRLEERVLEELAWSIDSPIWTILSLRADGVPSCQSVAIGQKAGERTNSSLPSHNYRPIAASPSRFGIAARYSTSALQFGPGKRLLDFDEGDESASKFVGVACKPIDVAVHRPASSTALFFRKVYYLASVRLLDLCDRLKLDDRGQQRVWTLFEYVLRTETSLMTGRHMDQNLMCCIYVIAKMMKTDTSFHDIMYHYRHQPQATSRVYRRVLLDPSISPVFSSTDDTWVGNKLRSGSTLPVPGVGSAPPTPEPTKDVDFADLIQYYNRVFLPRVDEFVKKLQPPTHDAKENTSVILSPIPSVRSHLLSPRRSIANHVRITPLSTVPLPPSRPLRYSFNRSPSKELKIINTTIRQSVEQKPPLSLPLSSYSSTFQTRPI